MNNVMAACLHLSFLLALSVFALDVKAQSLNSLLLPTATPDFQSDVLAPYSTADGLPQPTSTVGQLQPTPFPSSGSGGGGLEPAETTPFSVETTSTSPPSFDVIITLMVTFESGFSATEEELAQLGQNLSDIVRDVLELTVAPSVMSQDSGGVFVLLIATSSSRNPEVVRGGREGDYDAIVAMLSDDMLWSSLLGATSVSVIGVMRYEDTPPTIDHLAFPLWQWFVYAICAVIATTATLLLFCACCYRCSWKRQQSKRAGQGYRHLLLTQTRPHEEMVDFVHQTVDHELDSAITRKVSRISFRPRGPMQLLSHPLTPEELQGFMLNPLAVHMEYSSIPSNMVTMAEVPPGAEEKNRFKDVLPNPHTRVALFLKFAVPNSDYINANYIRGYRDAPKAYIATQGPLYWTVADFWRMVWEQKCSTIIMMTGLEEKGITKCARYWPNERVQHMTSYEDLELILKRKSSNKHYTTTTFHLRHKQKLVTREVTHFWFTSWPDHGVPSSARPIVEFLLKARHHLRDIPGPTVVHCSAGIGRTGVVIGAEVGMQQLEEKGEVDVLKIVSTLRQDRGGMVQTKEQYYFLYQVLVEYSKYLDELRSPYKVASSTSTDVARQPAARVTFGSSRLESPREEDEASNSTT